MVQIGLPLHSRRGCLWNRGCIFNKYLKKKKKKSLGWGGRMKEKERKMRIEKERDTERESESNLLENVSERACTRVCVYTCVLQTALWHGKCLLVLSRAELEACSKPFTFTAGLARCIERGWHSAMFITQRHDQRALVSGCTTFIWVPTADSSIRGGLSSPLFSSFNGLSPSLSLPYLCSPPLTHSSLQIRRLYLRFHSQGKCSRP